MVAALLVLIAVFVALGVWQVQRRAWKHELIAAVNTRTTAVPVAVPGPDQWPRITQQRDAYRHVTAQGHFLAGKDTLVQAVTELGGGYWVVTPLDTGGFTLLVNRGFVPQDRKRGYAPAPQGVVTVTGLLRVTEPGGGFLRSNKPAADQWYSRDVAAIAAARRLSRAAPYFVDADATLDVPGGPKGGLTVVRFSDNHLMYALTWFGMALLSAWAIYYVRRQGAGVRASNEGDTDASQ
nr:SURF1 family protein [Novosphingobium sp. Rr 2-17]